MEKIGELGEVNIGQLRNACLLLIDLMERQKEFFKTTMFKLIDGDPEATELFE